MAVNPYDLESQEIDQRQKYAELLRQQSMSPMQTQMSGRVAVQSSPFEGLAKMLQAYSGRKGIEMAGQERKDLMGRMDTERSTDMAALLKAYGGTPARPQQFDPQEAEQNADQGTPMPMFPATPGDPNQAAMIALQSRLPDVRQMAPGLMQIGETRVNREEDRTFRLKMLEQQGKDRLAQIEMQAREGRITKEEADKRAAQLREDMIRLAASLRPAAQPQPPVAIVGKDGNPVLVSPKDAVGQRPFNSKEATAKLPASALRMQQEELDTIGTASAINADLGAIAGQLATGGLDLGPIKNLASQAQNKLGLSDEKSRNFATLNATLEKLRNDSLRLNKGTQTEGDAKRAWDELIANINDKEIVKQRIGEIQGINKRAADLKKMNVDVIRNNFGVPALDTSGYENQPAAVGKGQSKWEVVR